MKHPTVARTRVAGLLSTALIVIAGCGTSTNGGSSDTAPNNPLTARHKPPDLLNTATSAPTPTCPPLPIRRPGSLSIGAAGWWPAARATRRRSSLGSMR